MVGIAPVEAYIDARTIHTVVVLLYDLLTVSRRVKTKIGVFISAYPILLEHNLHWSDILEVREDCSVGSDTPIGVLKVISHHEIDEDGTSDRSHLG